MIYNGLTPIHPGEYLTEILEELHISQALFARTIGVSPMCISHIVKASALLRLDLHCCLQKLLSKRHSIGSICKSAMI